MNCPICGASCPDESRFCSECGAALSADTPEVTKDAEEIIALQESPVSIQNPALESREADAGTECNMEIPDQETAQAEDADAEPEESWQEPLPLPKKGRLWVPVVILVILFAAGVGLFFASQTQRKDTDPKMPWFSIRDGVLYFDPNQYTGSSELEVPEIVAGQKVTVIAEGCFAGCSELTIVKLPGTVLRIENSAFEGCTSLRGLFVPEQVAAIGSKAFYGCGALESVCIPYTVKEIGQDAFSGCESLYYIFYSGPASSWKKLYSGKISPQTYIIAADQTVPHLNLPS